MESTINNRVGNKSRPGNYNRLTPLEQKTVQGRSYLKCRGEFHNKPTWIPEDDFYFITRYTSDGTPYQSRQKICKYCHHKRRIKYSQGQAIQYGKWRYAIHGRVAVSKMQGYLEELEARCGSVRKAADYAGVSKSAYLMWQGRLSSKTIIHMHRATALTIIVALRKKREEQEGIVIFRPMRKDQRRLGYCSHCGCSNDNYTTGCLGCMWRKNNRKHRLEIEQ